MATAAYSSMRCVRARSVVAFNAGLVQRGRAVYPSVLHPFIVPCCQSLSAKTPSCAVRIFRVGDPLADSCAAFPSVTAHCLSFRPRDVPQAALRSGPNVARRTFRVTCCVPTTGASAVLCRRADPLVSVPPEARR